MATKKHTTDEQYRENWINAARLIMVDNDIDNITAFSKFINIPRVTLNQIFNKRQLPTVEHGIKICVVGGFNANWLFLNMGTKKLTEQATLNRILNAMRTKRG